MQEVILEGNALDVTVAAHDLAEGDIALRIPEHMVITLSRVFEDEVPLPPVTKGMHAPARRWMLLCCSKHSARAQLMCKCRVRRRWQSC